MSKAIVLLSGGLDSAVTLALAKKKYSKIYALSFDYGQKHSREIRSAQKLARYFKVEHRLLRVEMPWKGSALLDSHIRIPKRRALEDIKQGIPATYVPARNTLFLSYGLSWAEAAAAQAIFIGANAVDYSGYPDCRPNFLRAMDRVFCLGTKRGVTGKRIRIEAPLLRLKKAEIVKLGSRLGVPFHLTWSCYRGGHRPCGTCDSCLLRAKGFQAAHLHDPLFGMALPGAKRGRS